MKLRTGESPADQRFHVGWAHGQSDKQPQPLDNDADYSMGWVNGYASCFGVSLEEGSRAMESWHDRHRRFLEDLAARPLNHKPS